MNLQGLNIETLLRRGKTVNPHLKRWNSLANDLCAVVGYKERLKQRGVRGTKIHWFWSAYLITNNEDYFRISNAVSVGYYERITFLLVRKAKENYWPVRPLTLKINNSLDENESGMELFRRLRERGTNE